jgi:hypothetical protein
MIAAGVEHLVVLDHGRVCGVLSAADVLTLEAHSPIGLRHTIMDAADEDELAGAVARLPQQFLALSRAGLPPRELGRVLSLAQDSVVARLIDFSIWRAGPAPLPWTRTMRWPMGRRSPERRPLLTTTSRGWAPTSMPGWPGAGSAPTTTACWRAIASGACPSRSGCGRSASA